MEKIRGLLENRKFQVVIMTSCFILSAILLILFVSQIYSFANQSNPPIGNNGQNDSNPPQRQPPARDDFFRGMPRDSPIMLVVFLLGTIIPFFSGMVFYRTFNVKDKKEVKTKIIGQMLLPEEKLMIGLLEKNNGEATQKELTIQSNFNKLKVSRVIKRLESLNLIEKFPYGMTNKVKLKTS